MKKVYVDRLNKLADFMETVPRKRLIIRDYVGSDWEGKEDLSCGTAACLLGWATTIKSFRNLGLRLKRDAYGTDVILNNQPGSDSNDVAKEVFGIESMHDLFMPYCEYDSPSVQNKILKNDGELTPKEAAARIRRYLKARQQNGL